MALAVAGAVGAFTVKNVLSGLVGSVDKTIEKRLNQVNGVAKDIILTLGEQIRLVIINAQMAYLDCMEETVEKLSEKAQETLNTLGMIVKEFESKTAETLGDLGRQVQQVANTLPGANKQPQLWSKKPNFIGKGKNLVFFHGNFPQTDNKEGFQPTFQIEGNVTILRANNTQELVFEIFEQAIQALEGRDSVQGVLDVPYDNGFMLSNKTCATYKIFLRVLPPSPGKIKVIYSSLSKDPQHRSFSHEVTAGEEIITRKNISEFPQKGWKIITKTVSIRSKRMDRITIMTKNEEEVTLDVAAFNVLPILGNKRIRETVKFQVEFDEFQYIPIEREEEVELKWGNSKMICPNINEKVAKIVFDCFDGRTQEFVNTLDDPYLKVSPAGEGRLRLSADI